MKAELLIRLILICFGSLPFMSEASSSSWSQPAWRGDILESHLGAVTLQIQIREVPNLKDIPSGQARPVVPGVLRQRAKAFMLRIRPEFEAVLNFVASDKHPYGKLAKTVRLAMKSGHQRGPVSFEPSLDYNDSSVQRDALGGFQISGQPTLRIPLVGKLPELEHSPDRDFRESRAMKFGDEFLMALGFAPNELWGPWPRIAVGTSLEQLKLSLFSSYHSGAVLLPRMASVFTYGDLGKELFRQEAMTPLDLARGLDSYLLAFGARVFVSVLDGNPYPAELYAQLNKLDPKLQDRRIHQHLLGVMIGALSLKQGPAELEKLKVSLEKHGEIPWLSMILYVQKKHGI